MAVSKSFLTKSVFSKMFRNATSATSATDRPDPNDPDVTIRAVDPSVNYRDYVREDYMELERIQRQYLNARPGELIPLEPRDRINFDTVRERMRASRDYMMSVNSYPPSIMTSGTINVDDIEPTLNVGLDVGNAMSLCCNARAMTEIHDEMAICSECKEWSIFINEEEEFTDETFEY